MQLFEDSIRARRRAARLNFQRKRKNESKNNSSNSSKKREISSEERFKLARDLITNNYSTNQISKILKISERSVTRFKKRIREEKRKLKAQGKIILNDMDEESSFKFLSTKQKIKRAKELFRKNLKIPEISNILKISERTVRRWKKRATTHPEEDDNDENDDEEDVENLGEQTIEPHDIKKEEMSDEMNDDVEDVGDRKKRKRKIYLDREKVQYASELIENGLSNKEMCMLLKMSIACVRKLKMKILNGTAEELIDDSEEHYTQRNNDPLHVLELSSSSITVPQAKSGFERKPKVILSDREMYIVSLLRHNGIRTMDIAKMLSISERSVTRLLSKARHLESVEYTPEIVKEVDKLMDAKDEILNTNVVVVQEETPAIDDNKINIGMNLLAMNAKEKDISSMLNVPEKTVKKWKMKWMRQQQQKNEDDTFESLTEEQASLTESEMLAEDHVEDDAIDEKEEEYIVEYLE
jgi:transposase